MTFLQKNKGVLDIEFIVSVMVFLTAIAFVSVAIVNTVPRLHQETFSQDLKSKSFQVSELLLFDSGEPSNWNTVLLSDDSKVKRLGLSNGTRYWLDPLKVAALNTYCSTPGNYDKVKSLLGLDYRNDFIIQITDTNSAAKLTCMPSATSQIRPKATITRLGVMPDPAPKAMVITVSIL